MPPDRAETAAPLPTDVEAHAMIDKANIDAATTGAVTAATTPSPMTKHAGLHFSDYL